MKIGIIVHSYTGHTLSVAERLREKLLSAGHEVNIERITVVGGENPNDKTVRIENSPDIKAYDGVVFAAPVRGGALTPAAAQYLKGLSSIKCKKIACLVTQTFPFPNWGGNQTVRMMKEICESKGASPCGSGLVQWMSRKREKRIIEVVDEISKLF